MHFKYFFVHWERKRTRATKTVRAYYDIVLDYHVVKGMDILLRRKIHHILKLISPGDNGHIIKVMHISVTYKVSLRLSRYVTFLELVNSSLLELVNGQSKAEAPLLVLSKRIKEM